MPMAWEEALEHLPVGFGDRYDAARSPLWYRARDVVPRYWIRTGTGKAARGWCSYCEQWSTVDMVNSQDHGALGPSDHGRPYVRGACDALAGIYAGRVDTLQENRGYVKLARQMPREDGTNQGNVMVCPMCYKSAIVKLASRKPSAYHSYMTDVPARFVTWTKSRKDPAAICAIVVDVFMSGTAFKPEHPNLEQGMMVITSQACVFRYGHPGERFIQDHKTWRRAGKCVSTCPGGVLYANDRTAFEGAISDTPYAWIAGMTAVQRYDHGMITTMDTISKRACLELVYRRGWNDLAQGVLTGDVALDMRAKSIPKLLKISPDEYQQIRSGKDTVNSCNLLVLREANELGLPIREAMMAFRHIGNVTQLDRAVNTEVASPKEIVRYLVNRGVNGSDYADYIHALERCGGLNREDSTIVFPSHFREAHDRAMAMQNELRRQESIEWRMTPEKLAEARDADGTVAATLEKFGRLYAFEHGPLRMRMFPTAKAVVQEGAAQCHCVGTYVGAYARGKVILCSLRYKAEPDKPLYTVELRPMTADVVQCRGYRNDMTKKGKARREKDQSMLDEFFGEFRVYFDEQIKSMRAHKARKMEESV